MVETSTENIDTLQRISGIANVWPVQAMSIPPPFSLGKPPINDEDRNISVHRWTGVQELHELGVKGKGTKIAVVDTGADYSHEAVGLAKHLLHERKLKTCFNYSLVVALVQAVK